MQNLFRKICNIRNFSNLIIGVAIFWAEFHVSDVNLLLTLCLYTIGTLLINNTCRVYCTNLCRVTGTKNYIKKMTPFDPFGPIPDSEPEKIMTIETDIERLSRKVNLLSDQIEFLVSKL